MEKEKRKKLVEAYKETKTYMGVFAVRNTVNGKIYIGSARNLKSRWLTLKGQLDDRWFANAALQADWNTYGAEHFVFEVLEDAATDTESDPAFALKLMEKRWLEKHEPYGEKGYNKPPKEA